MIIKDTINTTPSDAIDLAASHNTSYIEGNQSYALSGNSHAEGNQSYALNSNSHASGYRSWRL